MDKVKSKLTLLSVQDFIRASMTCINHFYRHNATSYNELGNRLHHLFTAQEHLYAYLDPMKWGSVSRPSSRIEVSSGPKDVGQSSCNAQLYMSKLDIQKLVSLIVVGSFHYKLDVVGLSVLACALTLYHVSRLFL